MPIHFDEHNEYEKASYLHQRICDLVEKGILGSELCPEPNYWHWPILKPELIPEELKILSYDDQKELCLYNV